MGDLSGNRRNVDQLSLYVETSDKDSEPCDSEISVYVGQTKNSSWFIIPLEKHDLRVFLKVKSGSQWMTSMPM